MLRKLNIKLMKEITLRSPAIQDGLAIHRLISQCPPLDTNSSYCNFLQASHFSATSVAAEIDGQLCGFISGYIIPERPNTLFIWQVAVAESARGVGLASQMLQHILNREACAQVAFLETTITHDNKASWALFKRLAASKSADLSSSVWIDKDKHFEGQHDSEHLVRIGPITRQLKS